MKNLPIPRLDLDESFRENLLPHCRLKVGEIWSDPLGRHRVGCLDATALPDIEKLMGDKRALLAVQDPPYNVAALAHLSITEYIQWSKKWVNTTAFALSHNAALYVWLGADQKEDLQPLPDFMLMMRDTLFEARSFLTMRNQRGYGTQQNWMAVRQELLYYIRGNPPFNVDAEYTDIPKILRGYYKEVNGELTENLERSKSDCIRAGNVWVDVQQVFYRMEENVNGCYVQKPLKAIERIIKASSVEGSLVVDFFCHSGTTLLGCERLKRSCYTIDIDPIYCEIAIRRLERFRTKGKLGWQNSNPFEKELGMETTLNLKSPVKREEEPSLF